MCRTNLFKHLLEICGKNLIQTKICINCWSQSNGTTERTFQGFRSRFFAVVVASCAASERNLEERILLCLFGTLSEAVQWRRRRPSKCKVPPFNCIFGNEDTKMEQHSAHNNACKTQKSHYTANTRRPVRNVARKRSVTLNAQWVVCFFSFSYGYGGSHPNGEMLLVGEEGEAKLYPQMEFPLSTHNIKHTYR